MAKQEEWETMQRRAKFNSKRNFAKAGLNVDASANKTRPRQLDFRSDLFKTAAFREAFMNKLLPEVNSELCSIGFQAFRILQPSVPNTGQVYPLHCQ